MDQLHIKTQLLRWLESHIEVPNKNLGDWAPCPYAKQARINNTIAIEFISSFSIDNIVQHLALLDQGYEVLIICFDHHIIKSDQMLDLVKEFNDSYLKKNYVLLEDHPHIPEYINNVYMNFGLCGLLVIQKLDLLNQAADKLKKTNYYSFWDPESLKSIVNWRYRV